MQATSSGHNIAVTNAITADLEPSFTIPGWTWQKENLMLKGIDDPVVVHYLQRAEGKKGWVKPNKTSFDKNFMENWWDL